MIFKYKYIIQDELHFPDFSESDLEYFESCLSLLVKIEEDYSGLKTNFVDRFRYLITKKFDEIFSMNEGISEINYTNFSKIYDNYEFAINENEYLFYEHQLEEMKIKENNFDGLNPMNAMNAPSSNSMSSTTAGNPRNNLDVQGGNYIECKNLPSKFFKKGTFIWICKKINESVISNHIVSCHKLYTKLFGDIDKNIQSLFAFVIDLFFKKLNDLIEKNKDLKEIDPIFLKEGLSSFYYPFGEALQKLEALAYSSAGNANTGLDNDFLCKKILNQNEKILNNYLKNYYLNFIIDVAKIFNETSTNIFNNLNNHIKQNDNTNNNLVYKNIINSGTSSNNGNTTGNQNIINNLFIAFYLTATSKIFLNNEISILNSKLQNLINEKISIIKKLDIADILSLQEGETDKIYFNNLKTIYNIPFYVIKCFNFYKQDCLDLAIHYSSGNRDSLTKEEKEAFDIDLNLTKKCVAEIFNLDTFIVEANIIEKEDFLKLCEIKKEYNQIFLFLFILFIKSLENPKALNEKFVKNFPNIKSNKISRNELTNDLEKNYKDSIFFLYEALIQIFDAHIFKHLKALFFDYDLQNYENAITFRLSLRELLTELFHFKKKLLIILEEEAKVYNETKLSTLNEVLLNKKQRKLTRFQKEMECLSIRRLAIYNLNINEDVFPQTIMTIIVKIFLKVYIKFQFIYYF